MFDKLLVANRGEIAVRIIRAAKELDLRTVAVFSDADKDSLAVHFADEAVHIGPSPAGKSYLNIDAIIAAARQSGAGAIHPGYGFLSENARFAEAVAAAGLVFVGPTAETIRMMGDKAAARAAAQAAGVPVVPGSEGEVADLDHALAAARKIGFPVMLKASAGGGGRGIRVAHDEAGFEHQFHTAQAEAKAAFGSGALYLERFLQRARHLEVQVLGDGEHVVHLLRARMLAAAASAESLGGSAVAGNRRRYPRGAVRLGRAARRARRLSRGGTLEYLYDENTGEFFFIEMNTRIQVEHPITEMITGIDLVREMIRIAQGEPLGLSQADVQMRGASIEVRINAEDPDKNFRPSPGKVGALALPAGPGVRVDTMLYPGYAVPALLRLSPCQDHCPCGNSGVGAGAAAPGARRVRNRGCCYNCRAA